MTTLVCISDSHGQHRGLDIPDGDILVHAGDITKSGEVETVEDFNAWLGALPHRHKVVIAGNHDFCFAWEPERCRALLTNAHYLQDQAITLDGLKFYGSPWQPVFFDMAFNLRRGRALRDKWLKIPRGTDVVVTHGPPRGIGDQLANGEAVGCADLLDVVNLLRPKVHVFGHIHGGHGLTRGEHTVFVNASVCDEQDVANQGAVLVQI